METIEKQLFEINEKLSKLCQYDLLWKELNKPDNKITFHFEDLFKFCKHIQNLSQCHKDYCVISSDLVSFSMSREVYKKNYKPTETNQVKSETNQVK
jgi:hypothetical protein